MERTATEVPGDGLPRTAADDREEADLHAVGSLRRETAAAEHPAERDALEAEDATPVALTLPELYPGLKSGRPTPPRCSTCPQISSFKLDEVQSHRIMTNHLVQRAGCSSTSRSSIAVEGGSGSSGSAGGGGRPANDKQMKTGELGYLIELQRKGMQVVIPDADDEVLAKPAVEELFKMQWSVTTWADVLALGSRQLTLAAPPARRGAGLVSVESTGCAKLSRWLIELTVRFDSLTSRRGSRPFWPELGRSGWLARFALGRGHTALVLAEGPDPRRGTGR